MQRLEAAGLGPFAPDQGPLNKIVAAAGASVALAVVVVIARIVADASGAGARPSVRPVIALGLAGVVLGIVGGYRATVLGQRGRSLGRIALWSGSVLAAFAFVYGALRDGTLRLGDFARTYFDTDVLAEIWPDLIRGLVNTLKAAVLGEALAIGVGIVFATWQLSDRWWLRRPAIIYVDVVRGLPLLVLASMIYFGLTFIGITLDPFPAVVATLTVNASAYVAEIFRAGIQAIPRGQTDAARSLGMPQSTTMLYVLIPQAFRSVIPPMVSEFIALTKDSAQVFLIVGITVASADLYNIAQRFSSSTFSPTPLMAAAIGYLIVTIPLARLVGVLERKLRAGLA